MISVLREKPKSIGCLDMFVAIHILDYSLSIVNSILEKYKLDGGENVILNNIVRLCKEKEISIARLERELGFGNATIRGWGNSSPNVDYVKKVADFFGVTVDSLIAASDETPTS